MAYQSTLPLAMKKVIPLTLNATAQTVALGGLSFSISNTGAQPVYIAEKYSDLSGADASPTNGFLIPANTTLPYPLTAQNLSVVSNATGSTANILTLDLV